MSDRPVGSVVMDGLTEQTFNRISQSSKRNVTSL